MDNLSNRIDDVISQLKVLQVMMKSDDPRMSSYARDKAYNVVDRMEILDNVPLKVEDL